MTIHSTETEALKLFFEEFTEVLINAEGKKIKEDLDSFQDLFLPLEKLMIQVGEQHKLTAPDYNIFEVINLSTYETRLHTPFLIHLLNPQASHGQNRLFFDGFIKYVFNDIDLTGISNIQLFEEYCGTFGRIDILILYHYKDRQKAIIVENKIYHHDEEKQLSRYNDHLLHERRLREEDYIIVYLTPHKNTPSEISIDKASYLYLKNKKCLVELGYKKDISLILKEAFMEIKAEPVKQIVSQYLKTIELL